MGEDGKNSIVYYSLRSDGVEIKQGVLQIGSDGIPVYFVGSSGLSSSYEEITPYLESINDLELACSFCLSIMLGLIVALIFCVGLKRG